MKWWRGLGLIHSQPFYRVLMLGNSKYPFVPSHFIHMQGPLFDLTFMRYSQEDNRSLPQTESRRGQGEHQQHLGLILDVCKAFGHLAGTWGSEDMDRDMIDDLHFLCLERY